MNANSWLNSASKTIPRLDAELILANILGERREFLHAHPDFALNNNQLREADRNLERRAQKEPLAYILGVKEFYGREFRVTPDVLIPRPETETIIDYVKSLSTSFLRSCECLRIIDVGTGSGCIAISLALELPSAQISAVDISRKALDCAQYNAKALGVKSISMMFSDLLSSTDLTEWQFDIIIANLPYVDRTWSWLDLESLSYEPSLALFADDSGLKQIKKLIDQAVEKLIPGGILILEADVSQHAAISSHAIKHGFSQLSSSLLSGSYILAFSRE